MRIEDFTFTAGAQTLAGSRVIAAPGRPPDILYFHGLGLNATRRRIFYLLEHLAQHGLSSLCFDFSGNGDSTGKFEEACLRLRMQEARAALRLLGQVPVRAMIGTSMGAHIAASLSAETPSCSLILFSPAAYPDDVADIAFGEPFTNRAQRFVRPGRQTESSATRALAAAAGNLLIVAGDEDAVVPRDVIDLHADVASKVRRKKIVRLKGCGHFVHPWLDQHEEERTAVLQAALDCISDR